MVRPGRTKTSVSYQPPERLTHETPPVVIVRLGRTISFSVMNTDLFVEADGPAKPDHDVVARVCLRLAENDVDGRAVLRQDESGLSFADIGSRVADAIRRLRITRAPGRDTRSRSPRRI